MKPALLFARGVVALALAATAAWGAGAGDAGAGDAGAACTTSVECSRPVPHCHATRHQCVQCLADNNCSGGLCDEATGVCTGCISDADCPSGRPYCAAGACVQCRTNANCGQGITCAAGTCGGCGDGVCHLSESILRQDPSLEDSVCQEDCASLCPTHDVQVDELRTAHFTRDLFEANCTNPTGLNDVTLTFTPPKNSFYRLEMRPDVPGALLYLSQLSSCLGEGVSCTAGGFEHGYTFAIPLGGTLTLLIESETARSVEFRIVEGDPVCTENCEPEPPEVDSGKPPPAETARCLADAASRGERSCDGVTCACTECPAAYEDCAGVAGCDEVFACMQTKGCTGVDCYTTGACRRSIDPRGGISGEAFRGAVVLQSCALAHVCALPCAEPDASAPPPPDPGALCEPGREVACSCGDGGTGTKRCLASGDAFGGCVCAPLSAPTEDPSSCDCNVGRRAGPAAPLVILFGLAAGFACRRGMSRHASRRRR